MSLPRHASTAALYPVADLRAYLTGAWEIRRSLEDGLRGVRGTFDGWAAFTPDG